MIFVNPPSSSATLAAPLQQSQTSDQTVRREVMTRDDGEARFFVKVVSTVSEARIEMIAPQVRTPVQFLLNVTRILVGTRPQAIAVTDLNGDGRPDLVTANQGSNDVSVLLGGSDGTFAAQQRFAMGVGAQPTAVAVADLNGDITPDLVTADAGFSAVTVLLGRGDGTFGKLQLSP